MTQPAVIILLGLCLAAAPACGRKGPLVLPPGRAPMPVTGLTAAGGDGRVVLRWTNPTKEISGRPLAGIGAIEIWLLDRGPAGGGGPLSPDRIEKTGRLVRTIAGRDLAGLAAGTDASPGAAFTYVLPPSATAPAKLAFAVRVRDRRGRASEFAGPVAFEVPGKGAGVDPSPAEGVS